MNFQDRLSTLSKSEARPTQVIDVEDNDINDLAQKVNSSGVAGSVNKSLNVYEAPRAELVKNSLAVKAELLTSQSRLKDADNIKLLVMGLKDLQERTQAAKEEGRANMEQAQAVLDEATVELKQILNV